MNMAFPSPSEPEEPLHPYDQEAWDYLRWCEHRNLDPCERTALSYLQANQGKPLVLGCDRLLAVSFGILQSLLKTAPL